MLHLTKARARDIAAAKSYTPLIPRSNAQCSHRFRYYSSGNAYSNEGYKHTIKNLLVGKDTRVMFQGFTGKQATLNAMQSIEYGTNVVGGMSPNKSGEHLGLPVYPTVKEAARYLKPDATSIFVSATHATSAIIEAIEAEIPLISAVAEHVPVHEMLRVHSILRTQSKSRLLGPNSPGMLHAVSRCRIGFMPYPQFSPGVIGIVAKSGTLGYEAVASTTRAGLGQTYVIGVGGDALAGTSLREGLELVWGDENTKGVVVIGEIGGDGELEMVEFLREKRNEGGTIKPIMGLIAGITAPLNRTMGHSGAFTSGSMGDVSAADKVKAWEAAGIQTVVHPGQFGEGMKRLLSTSGKPHLKRNPHQNQQVRHLHMLCMRRSMTNISSGACFQKRQYQVSSGGVVEFLKLLDIPIASNHEISTRDPAEYTKVAISLAISRRYRCPCVILSSPLGSFPEISLPFAYEQGPNTHLIEAITRHAQTPLSAQKNLLGLLRSLYKDVFQGKEAFLVELDSVIIAQDGLVAIEVKDEAASGVRVYFDDAAYKSCRRHTQLWNNRDETRLAAAEVQAQKNEIVYIKLGTERGLDEGVKITGKETTSKAYIGCLVNGAGLAMNTNDVLAHHGGYPVNFIDTGGKATSDTIKECFRLILLDKRAKAIFVNIFGGLTLCDMIASGIILAVAAYREQLAGVPVVVRLRGTNQDEGQKMLRESILPGVYAFDELDEAVKKVIELARERE